MSEKDDDVAEGQNGGPLTREFIALEAKRVDDLRAAEIRRVDAEMRRLDELRAADHKRLDDLQAVHLLHSRELAMAEARRLDSVNIAEARRLDALLAANTSAVGLASTRAELTASALAERVDTSAKQLAAQVESSAKALAAQVDATAIVLARRLEPLEQARYEQAGRTGNQRDNKDDRQWLVPILMMVPSVVIAIIYLMTQFQQ